MQLLKQSTSITIPLGQCVDPDGANYTGLVIGDLTLSKNGTSAALAASATLTSTGNGMYDLVLTDTNTNTLGRLDISVNKSGYNAPPARFEVLQATVFDALVTNATTSAGGLGDIQRVAGTVQTAADVGSLVGKFSGITSVARWLAAIMGKTADASTQTEIRAVSGGAAANYTITTDSLEAIADAMDPDAIADAVVTAIAGQSVVIASPVIVKTSGGLPVSIEVVQGADYLNANSTAITLTMSGTFPVWTGGTPYLDIDCGASLSVAGTMVTATGSTRVMRFDLTAAQTATLTDTANDQDDIDYDQGWFDARIVMSASDVQKPISRATFIARRPA